MMQRNNLPVKYKGQTIWTNAPLLRVFMLLLAGKVKRDNPSYELALNPFYIEFNFEVIFPDDMKLKIVKEAIDTINEDINTKDYLVSNNLGQRIASTLKLINPNIDKRTLSKEVTEATNIRPAKITELFSQVKRTLNEEYPFPTDQLVAIEFFFGKWESKTVADILDFDINFNMTDFSPAQKVFLQIWQDDSKRYSITVSIPALDFPTNKTVELKLINGNVSLDKGILTVTEAGNPNFRKIPIIRAERELFETFLFKSRVTFERVSR